MVGELAGSYLPVQRYATRRKILVVADESEEEPKETQSGAEDSEDESVFEVRGKRKRHVIVYGEDGTEYYKKHKNLYWNYDTRGRTYSSSSMMTGKNSTYMSKNGSPRRSANINLTSPVRPVRKQE